MTLPIIQDCEKVAPGKRKEVRDMYTLFLKSEFPESPKVLSLEEETDLVKLMLDLRNIAPIDLVHRDDRGYMIVEGVSFSADVRT